jgi:predicted Zn-dependent protease
LEASWFPKLLGLKTPDGEYLVVLSFSNLNVQVYPADRLAQAHRYIDKGKPEKAIPTLNRLIEDYPYGKEYYETRAKAFARMRNNEEFKKNAKKIVS